MSRTDHPRMNGTHRALTKYYRYWWEDGYSESLSHKRYAWFVTDQVAIAEGLADMAEDQPLPWWGLTAEREIEERVIGRNLDNAWLMEGLAAMGDWDREVLEDTGHSNLIPFKPRYGGWDDPFEPDYWDDTETDEDEDLDDDTDLAPWERELLGMSA